MARKRGVERDEREVFLSELSRHGSVRKACRVACVSRGWVREQQKDPEFSQQYHDAVEDSIDRVEEKANLMARNGDDKLIRFLLEVKRYKRTNDVDLGQVKPTINLTIGVSNGTNTRGDP